VGIIRCVLILVDILHVIVYGGSHRDLTWGVKGNEKTYINPMELFSIELICVCVRCEGGRGSVCVCVFVPPLCSGGGAPLGQTQM